MSRHPLGVNDITVLPPPTQNPDRAFEIYNSAFLRVMEYVTHSNIPGEILEFGTYHGYTARTFAENMHMLKSKKELHLYDSWEGFPRPSGQDANCPEVKANIWVEGSCNPVIDNAEKAIETFINVIIPEQVFIHKGFYEKTVPYNLPEKAAVVHIDCDLYESTVHVLHHLISKFSLLSQGTVILFDDFNNNGASWAYGERAALRTLFPLHEAGIHWTSTWKLLGLEPWFTYGSAGYAFIVHKTSIATVNT